MSSTTLTTISVRQTNGVAAQVVFSKAQISTKHNAAINSTRAVTLTRKLPKTIARHLSVKRRATEAEGFGGLAEIALVLRNGALDRELFQLFEIQRRGFGGRGRRPQQPIELEQARVT